MNRESYNAIASQWDVSRRSFFGRERDYLEILLRDLPRPSEVLDLGCGTGRPMAEYILSTGHHVTGVDQAESLLALARERFPSATWINASIEAYVPPPRTFSAIVCWDSLFHIDRVLHGSLLERFANALPPNGKLMLTCGGSDDANSGEDDTRGFTDTMYGHTFFYDSHSPEKLLAMLGSIGFSPIISEYMNPPTSGRDRGRYAIVAVRI